MSERVGSDKERFWILNDIILNQFWKFTSFKFGVVLCRIRPFPTLISKIKWLGSELPLSPKINAMSAAVITKILMKAQERAQGQGHSRTLIVTWLTDNDSRLIHKKDSKRKEGQCRHGRDENRCYFCHTERLEFTLGPWISVRLGRTGPWIPAKRDNEYDVAFSQWSF